MVISTNPEPRWKRPDILELIGPEFDSISCEPAKRTLIICSSPRTGSFELCRYLAAAGIGVPHEYFHVNFSRLLARRWGIVEHPLEEPQLGRYTRLLRRRRVQNGVFATKLHYPQFNRSLKNSHGAALFDGACVVHLYRPDVVGQYKSFRAAIESGFWDFSQRQTHRPKCRDRTNFDKYFAEALDELDVLIAQDADFRRLFVLLGIRPIFVTTAELFSDPRTVIKRVANAMALMVDEEALQDAIACSAAYRRDEEGEKAIAELAERFKQIAFQG